MAQEKEPRLFSYIITSDTGLAPNPYWGNCTLAVCKPQVRERVETGDWVVGLSPKPDGHRLVYVMQVKEKLGFAEYFLDPRFSVKKPHFGDGDVRCWRGDNFYQEGENGRLKQLPGAHSNPDGSENERHKKVDLGGKFVVIADHYSYLGKEGKPIPEQLGFLKVRRGHRSRFQTSDIEKFLEFARKLPEGTSGEPKDFEKAFYRQIFLVDILRRGEHL